MKNFILGLCATFLFSVAVQAQHNTYTKSAMVVLVSGAKSTYTKGMTYKDWVANIAGKSAVPSPQEDKVLKDVYGFLSVNANPETISRNYSGQSLLELAKTKGSLGTLSASNAKCGFWCELLNAVVRAIIDYLSENPPVVNP
ncbi:hypothetical protein [Flavobacterium caeni]|uniref:Uncharacterized protein n=1 Tax=Flavobacterium caeni TaxID=490189 RepID=A0A1G5GX97_9FLAO|nr:hypothetical protein [Flavobacterium caeni]SCY55760.1 hypothetical protein SAMN02927903_01652 [Flavobacterium caeni]